MTRQKTVYALTGAALLSAGITTAANAAPADYKPLAEYYANRLVVGADHLQAAVQSGDHDAARTAWNAMRPAQGLLPLPATPRRRPFFRKTRHRERGVVGLQ